MAQTPMEQALAAAVVYPIPLMLRRGPGPYPVAAGMIEVNGFALRVFELSDGSRTIDVESAGVLLDGDLATDDSPAADLRRQAAILSMFLPSELTPSEAALARAGTAAWLTTSHAAWAAAHPTKIFDKAVEAEHEFLFGLAPADCGTCETVRQSRLPTGARRLTDRLFRLADGITAIESARPPERPIAPALRRLVLDVDTPNPDAARRGYEQIYQLFAAIAAAEHITSSPRWNRATALEFAELGALLRERVGPPATSVAANSARR
jgi:hypothetical protein